MKKYLLFLFFAIPVFGFSQYEFYNKGADIYVQEGALVHVQGNVTNDNGAANGLIENDGVIELKGDLENKSNATFTYNTLSSSMSRSVNFVGSGTQKITGNFNDQTVTGSFYNIVIDQVNDADKVEMNTNVAVKG